MPGIANALATHPKITHTLGSGSLALGGASILTGVVAAAFFATLLASPSLFPTSSLVGLLPQTANIVGVSASGGAILAGVALAGTGTVIYILYRRGKNKGDDSGSAPPIENVPLPPGSPIDLPKYQRPTSPKKTEQPTQQDINREILEARNRINPQNYEGGK